MYYENLHNNNAILWAVIVSASCGFTINLYIIFAANKNAKKDGEKKKLDEINLKTEMPFEKYKNYLDFFNHKSLSILRAIYTTFKNYFKWSYINVNNFLNKMPS